jgi:protein required for attachment to host cells
MPVIDRTPTWILNGNSSRARLFSAPGVAGPWTLVRMLEHPGSRAKVSELVTDDRGRSRQSLTRARPAMEPEVSPKRMEAIRFAEILARVLEDGLDRREYERLVIIVPPRFLGLLRRRMPKRVAARVGAVLEKDYTALEAREVKEQLAA